METLSVQPRPVSGHQQQTQDVFPKYHLDLKPSLKEKLLSRSRWDGVLNAEEIRYCREQGISLGYDCAQIGWVVINSEEDNTNKKDHLSSKTNSEHHEIEELKKAYSRALENLLQECVKSIPIGEIYKKSINLCAYHVNNFSKGASANTLNRCHFNLLKELSRQTEIQNKKESNEKQFIFRSWQQSDVDAYLNILGNPNVWKYLPEEYPSSFTREVAQDLIEIANLGDHHSILAIEYESKVIGQVRLIYSNEYPEIRTAEVAYILGEEYWGKGLMTGILREFTPMAIEEHNLDFVHAWILKDHLASTKVAERAGFIRDNFSHEAEIASASDRSDFSRYIYF